MDPRIASVSSDKHGIPIFSHICDLERSGPWVFELLIGSGQKIPPHLLANLKLPHLQPSLYLTSLLHLRTRLQVLAHLFMDFSHVPLLLDHVFSSALCVPLNQVGPTTGI